MDKETNKALEIFYPRYLARVQRVQENKLRFVHYTSAECALSIIKNEEIWLRNSQCMNDFLELEHGFECLKEVLLNENEGKAFRKCLNELFADITNELIKLFDGWLPYLRSNTYITSVSEHLDAEDYHGRLSMWRAYGNRNSVALVLNNNPFLADTNVFEAYTVPVEYHDGNSFPDYLDNVRSQIEKNKEFVLKLGKDGVLGWLFLLFKNIVQGVKHPGFQEEREWRVVYTPDYKNSKHVKSDIKVINGVPQVIHKIPLKNIPEQGFNNATIPEFVNRVIIGPSDHQEVLRQAFEELLTNVGCEDSSSRVYCSGIPLR